MFRAVVVTSDKIYLNAYCKTIEDAMNYCDLMVKMYAEKVEIVKIDQL